MNQHCFPKHWIISKLGEQLVPLTEKVEPFLSPNQKFFFVGLENIESHTGNLLQTSEVLGSEIKSTKKVFSPNNILYGKLRPYLNKVHKSKQSGICSTDIWVFKTSSTLDIDYASYYLRSTNVLQKVTQVATGANLPRIDEATFGNIYIPLPPLPEQRRIAAILGQADELRQLRREAMNKASQLLSSSFYEMFGDPVTNERKWETKTIREIGQVVTGNTPSRDIPEYYGDFIEWIKSDNLDSFSGYILPSKEKLSKEGAKKGRIVPCGSTLITCIAGSHESIGKAAFANRELSFNQQINAIVPFNGIEPNFLFANLKLSKSAIQSFSSKGMKGIVNKTQLENVKLIIPPENMQKKFSGITFEIMESLIDQENSYNQLHSLFQSLLSQAFTGELTAAWREKHADELAKAVQERDELLAKQKTPSHSVSTGTPINTLTTNLGLQELIRQKCKDVLELIAADSKDGMAKDTAQMLRDTREGLMLDFIKLIQSSPDEIKQKLKTIIKNVIETSSEQLVARLFAYTHSILDREFQKYNVNAVETLDGEIGLLRQRILQIIPQVASYLFYEKSRSYFLDELKLSKEQYQVYQATLLEEGYFTAEKLRENHQLDITQVRRGLQLLEGMGMIMQVYTPSFTSSKTAIYSSAYRVLWPMDSERIIGEYN